MFFPLPIETKYIRHKLPKEKISKEETANLREQLDSPAGFDLKNSGQIFQNTSAVT